MSEGEASRANFKVGEIMTRTYCWWVDELTNLIPQWLRRLYTAKPCMLVVVIETDGIKVNKETQKLRKSNPDMRLLHDGEWSTALHFLAEYARPWGPLLSIGLRLPIDQCLIRNKDLPSAALRNASDILLLDLERIAPFSRSEILSDWYREPSIDGAGDGSLATVRLKQLVVKRSLLDPYIRDLKAAGLSLVNIDAYDENRRVLPVNLLAQDGGPPRGIEQFLSKTIGVALVTVFLLIAGIAMSTIYQQEKTLARLAQQTAKIRRQAVAVKTELSKENSIIQQISGHRLRWLYRPTVLQIWEEVTRHLPQSVWVTNFRILEDQLYLDGFARSASELIGTLGRSKYLSNVSFTSPVIADLQQGQERFQIRAKILQPAQGNDDDDDGAQNTAATLSKRETKQQ